MGFRYRKSIKVAPGVRVNVGKRGVTSVSAGRRGLTTNVSKRGTRHTLSVPGTGMSYRTATKKGSGCGSCIVPAIITGAMACIAMTMASRSARRRLGER